MNSRSAICYLLCAITALVAACTTPAARIPAWIAPAHARTYTASEVIIACGQLAPAADVETVDATFTPVAHTWLEQTLRAMPAIMRSLDIAPTPESFDCDKFALGFSFACNLAAMRAGVKAQPLCARIGVVQLRDFAGLQRGGNHGLNALLTDRGLYILEPQTLTLVPFAEYPNRETIFRIRFGG